MDAEILVFLAERWERAANDSQSASPDLAGGVNIPMRERATLRRCADDLRQAIRIFN